MEICWILLTIILLAVIPRSVHTNLGFYEQYGTVHIYHHVEQETISFQYEIPDAVQSAPFLARISSIIEKLPNFDSNETNTMLYRSEKFHIVKTLQQLKENLIEISEYSSIDLEIHESPCHVQINCSASARFIKLLATNIDTLYKQIPSSITTGKLMEPIAFTKIYRGLKNILSALMVYHQISENYLLSMISLTKGIVDENTFDLLKESTCLESNPQIEFLSLRECSFKFNKVQCILDIQTPSKRERLGKIRAVPYFGYEIANLENAYVNLTKGELVKLDCQHKDYALSNCGTFYNNTECFSAIKLGLMEKIIQECKFKQTSLFTPARINRGILIPQVEDIQLFFVQNSTLYNESIPADIQAPFVIRNNGSIVIKHSDFTYLFKPTTKEMLFETTGFSDSDLEMLSGHLGTWYWLTYENLIISVQVLVAILASLLTVVTGIICKKFYNAKRELHRMLPKNPRGQIYSQTLRHFMTDEITPMN